MTRDDENKPKVYVARGDENKDGNVVTRRKREYERIDHEQSSSGVVS